MYTLRFPFELPPGRALSETPAAFRVEPLTISLEPQDPFHTLTITGFPTAADAAAFVPRVAAGMTQLMLDRGIACKMNLTLQKVHFHDDPAQAARNIKENLGLDRGPEVHGVIDAGWPAVYPTNGTFLKLTAGKASVLMSTSSAQAAESIRTGMQRVNAHALLADERLQTALELYGFYLTETSPRSRLITLVMVLETLAEGRRRPELVQRLLREFSDRAHDAGQALAPGTEEAFALQALLRELDFRREDSIRSQVRELVRRVYGGDEAQETMARRVVSIYDNRSTLVHTGTLPPDELSAAVTDAQTIVKRVLEARLAHPAPTEN